MFDFTKMFEIMKIRGRILIYESQIQSLKTYNKSIGDKIRNLKLDIKSCEYSRANGVCEDNYFITLCSHKEQKSIQNTIDMLKDLQDRNGEEILTLRTLLKIVKQELYNHEKSI